MSNKLLFRSIQQLRKEGQQTQALTLLQNALRRGLLHTEEIDKAGRILQQLQDSNCATAQSILLLGQFTTSWLKNSLAAVALARNLVLQVNDGEYDNVLQDLMRIATSEQLPRVIILAPWTQRLLTSDNRSEHQRIEDELAFWQQAWQIIAQYPGTRILQLGYDCVSPGVRGHHLGCRAGGDLYLVRQLNDMLRERMPPGGYFVDLSSVAAEEGKTEFYDARQYYWTKQPFSESGLVRLAEHLTAGIRAITTGPKKVLILDLDNTIWGGVVGEVGPHGVELGDSPNGEAHRALQRYAKQLCQRGVLLAVCSKNNFEDAQEPFEKNVNMLLSLDDIATFEASWDAKPVAIRRIADTLRLGLDSMVFVDDNPAEREHVRAELPEVEVVELSTDPADYVAAIERGLWFEALELTSADQIRTEQYVVEGKRRELQQSFCNMDDYLLSLQMIGDVRPIGDQDMQRVVQLLGKTNQFNLTTVRHTQGDVENMQRNPSTILKTMRVSDKFGDYGLASVIIGLPADNTSTKTIVIDTWLMSCRVIGRTAEHFLFQDFLEAAQKLGYEKILGRYVPTQKNKMVATLYEQLGFRKLGVSEDGTVSYEKEVGPDVNSNSTASTTFVRTAA